MDVKHAVDSLAALAQENRLEIFRLLMRAGEAGVAAGEIARAMGSPHNTVSSQLAILARAGLIRAARDGRSIVYAADYAGVRGLIVYLMEDCCAGRPEICNPVLNTTAARCASASLAEEPAR